VKRERKKKVGWCKIEAFEVPSIYFGHLWDFEVALLLRHLPLSRGLYS